MREAYAPVFELTPKILSLSTMIAELISSVAVTDKMETSPRLRRENRIKTIHSSLAIENNSLSLSEVTAIIDGKRVLAPPNEIAEVKNAYDAYNRLLSFDPYSIADMLEAHLLLAHDLVIGAGAFRHGNVGVMRGSRVIHVAPPPARVPELIRDLLEWTKNADLHPLIKSCIFHYEFEFIHPFADGNGRMGRMWQTLLLYNWRRIFAWLPVETVIKERQEQYYQAIGKSTKENNCAFFIEFLLQALCDSLVELANTSGDEAVSPSVALLLDKLGSDVLSAKELMARLGLKSMANFRKVYLMPALALHKIEMTLPDSPSSRTQRYRKT